jgi:hypothetical protein
LIILINVTVGTKDASLTANFGKRSDDTPEFINPPKAGIKDAKIAAFLGFVKNA